MTKAEQRIAELEKQLAQAKSERRKEIYEQQLKLERENKKLRNTLDSVYAKNERLWQWARETLTGDVADQFWQIAANGSLMHENPEYQHRLNLLKHGNKQLETDIQTVIAERDKLRAKCATMREALEKAQAALLVGYSMDCGYENCYSKTGIQNHLRCGAHESIINAWFKIKNALSTTASRNLLGRVNKLEFNSNLEKEELS